MDHIIALPASQTHRHTHLIASCVFVALPQAEIWSGLTSMYGWCPIIPPHRDAHTHKIDCSGSLERDGSMEATENRLLTHIHSPWIFKTCTSYTLTVGQNKPQALVVLGAAEICWWWSMDCTSFLLYYQLPSSVSDCWHTFIDPMINIQDMSWYFDARPVLQ